MEFREIEFYNVFLLSSVSYGIVLTLFYWMISEKLVLTELEIGVGKDWTKKVRKDYRYISNEAGKMAFKLAVKVREGGKKSKSGDPCWEIPGIGQLRKWLRH